MRFRRHQEAAENATWGMLAGFAASVLLLVVAVNLGLALAWWLTVPIASGLPPLFIETNTAVVLLFVLGGCWVETLRLREGGAYVARLAGARPAEPSSSAASGAAERRLVNIIQEMALASRARPPTAWVLPRDDSINAFAAGWTPEDAVIAVTGGALERLTREELQGLVGHELAHIVSGDTRLHTRLIGLVWGLQMVHGFGQTLAARDEQGRPQASMIIGLALMAMGWLGWLAGRLLQAAVARQREFHADASAVQFARTVDGIGGALRKIAGHAPERRSRGPESLAHLWASEAAGDADGGWLRRLLATHPPIAQRLQRLYGRPMPVLEAPLLPPPSDEPMIAMAPPAAHPPPPTARMAMVPPRSRAAAAPTGGAIDAASTDEHDALQRSTYWRSRGERHAALLAWLIDADGERADWTGWRLQAGRAAFVDRLRDDWLALGPAARWDVFDAMVKHTRDASPADRQALLLAARGLAKSDAARLRAVLLRRALRGSRGARCRVDLEQLRLSMAAASALLARAMGAPGAAWAVALGGPADAAAPGAFQRAFALRRLDPMQRPRVARAWVEAASSTRLLNDRAVADSIVAACRLLDTPLPPAL